MSDLVEQMKQNERRLFVRMIMSPHWSGKRKRLAERYWRVYEVRKAMEDNTLLIRKVNKC